MIMKKRPKERIRGPVLSVRVPQEFYDQIVATAAQNGRTAPEELIHRAMIASMPPPVSSRFEILPGPWRPMSEAKKDGSWILARDENGFAIICRWTLCGHKWVRVDPETQKLQVKHEWAAPAGHKAFLFTHPVEWMPVEQITVPA